MRFTNLVLKLEYFGITRSIPSTTTGGDLKYLRHASVVKTNIWVYRYVSWNKLRATWKYGKRTKIYAWIGRYDNNPLVTKKPTWPRPMQLTPGNFIYKHIHCTRTHPGTSHAGIHKRFCASAPRTWVLYRAANLLSDQIITLTSRPVIRMYLAQTGSKLRPSQV